jgi:hypothetical protein
MAKTSLELYLEEFIPFFSGCSLAICGTPICTSCSTIKAILSIFLKRPQTSAKLARKDSNKWGLFHSSQCTTEAKTFQVLHQHSAKRPKAIALSSLVNTFYLNGRTLPTIRQDFMKRRMEHFISALLMKSAKPSMTKETYIFALLAIN